MAAQTHKLQHNSRIETAFQTHMHYLVGCQVVSAKVSKIYFRSLALPVTINGKTLVATAVG